MTPLRKCIVGLAGMALLPALASCGSEAAYDKPLTPVLIADARSEVVTPPRRYSAVVEPDSRIDLAFRVGGYVTSLGSVGGRPIEDGDRIAAGAVLATVRPEDYEARVGQARSQLAEATAAREAAAQALARAESLFNSRSLTKPELDQARATVESIDAKIAGARNLVQEAELTRNDTTLRAPVAGVVLKRLVEVGSLVGPGTPGFVLADMRNVSVVIGVPDTMLAAFPVGLTARVTSEAVPGRRYDGRVVSVAPAADPRSRLFDVKVTLANADGALKPGMVATVDVAGDAEGAASSESIVVPLSAVVRGPDGSGYAVFIVEGADGAAIARRRPVQLGRLLGNEIIVVSGLQGTERIITQGATIVADGERVNPTR